MTSSHAWEASPQDVNLLGQSTLKNMRDKYQQTRLLEAHSTAFTAVFIQKDFRSLSGHIDPTLFLLN